MMKNTKVQRPLLITEGRTATSVIQKREREVARECFYFFAMQRIENACIIKEDPKKSLQ